jgi:hypothetical protein
MQQASALSPKPTPWLRRLARAVTMTAVCRATALANGTLSGRVSDRGRFCLLPGPTGPRRGADWSEFQ